MYYGELHPRPELKPWVAAHWHFRVEPGAPGMDHWIPPSGGAMLAIPAGGEPVLTGPRTEPLEIQVGGGDQVWGSILWRFLDSPRGKIRYTIRIQDDEWHEIGEFSADGENWQEFFGMDLQRVDP